MKEKFGWYIKSSSTEAEKAWDTAILTVDTNVLLDLYRYYATTRESILASLSSFEAQLWLSDQAASEFFNNRKKVIASAEETFRQARTALDDTENSLDGAVAKLRGFRLVPRAIIYLT